MRLLVIPFLPHRTSAAGHGCHFTDRLVILVECRGTPADDLLGSVLTWAYFWTDGVVWLAAFFPPVLVFWLASLILAIRFCFVLRRPLRGNPAW